MDSLLISIFKILSSSLSLYQFFIVACCIVVAVVGTAVIISRRSGTSLLDLIKKSPKDPIIESLTSITSSLDTKFSVNADQLESLNKIITTLDIQLKHTEQLIRKQSSDLVLMKRDMVNMSSLVTSEFDEIKHSLRMHDNSNSTAFDMIKTNIANTEAALKQMTNRLEKLDDFARSVFPEFKSYHRDLDHALRQIQTDIAIITNLTKIGNNSLYQHNGPTLR